MRGARHLSYADPHLRNLVLALLHLTASARLLCGFWSIFLSPGRIRKVAIALRPSTLLAFHRA